MTDLTKKELLALAKDLQIAGRHEMTRDALDAAVEAATKALNAKTQSIVDSLHGNFIPTKPFNVRRYSVVGKNEEAYNALPKQAKAIYDYMVAFPSPKTGHEIVNGAVAEGFLKTTQKGDVLFAFYARKLEDAGIRLFKNY